MVKQNAYILGNDKAPLLFIEYGDLECPYCKQMYTDGIIAHLRKIYGDTFSYVFKNYPLSFHTLALPAANTMECVAEQGGEAAYYIFMDEIFGYDIPTKGNINSVLERMKLNNDAMKTCITEQRYQDTIDAQMTE